MTRSAPGAVADAAAPILSPPPPSRGLATASLAVAVGLLLLVGIGGGGTIAALEANGPAAVAVLGTVVGIGTVVAVLLVVLGVAAVRRAAAAGAALRAGDVLGARADADRARQDAFIALGGSLALAIAIALTGVVTMNDASIVRTFLNADFMFRSSGDIVRAFGLNIMIAVCAQVLILALGLVLAVARMTPGRAGRPIRMLAIAYIDTMRAIPAIIVIYLIGFGLPLAQVPFLSGLPPVWYAIIALALTHSAYVAEIYRSGIDSVHPSQSSASRSLGFSYGQTLRHVVLPQAVRAVVPPLLSAFIALQKDTALVNVIGAVDAFNQAKYFAATNFNLSSVTVVAVLFILITIPQARFVDAMLARGTARRRGRTT